MANMLYNGVELPALPEYDTQTYHVGGIVAPADESGNYMLFLSRGAYPTSLNEGKVAFGVALVPALRYTCVDGVWTNPSNSGFNTQEFATERVLWTQIDIADDSGNIVFYGSDPVPVTTTPTLLYNGLSLPDISTVWDKTTRPFATIEQSIVGGEVTGEYAVIFSAEKGAVGADGTDYEDTLVIGGEWVKYRYNPDLGFTEWTEQTDNVTFDGDAEVAVLDLVWANYDVPDGDGTTFLKASDPLDPEAELVKGQIYKYNGVELGLLPEVTTDFPYLYLVQVQEAYESATTFKYALFASTHRAVYDQDADNVVVPTVSDGYYMFRDYAVAHDDDRFVWDSFARDSGNDANLNLYGTATILWSNTDILNSSDGSVYFAATKAVKVGGLHMPSYWAGFVFGLLTPEFKSKSGMYSYNGTVLPALPEWNRKTYPYAVIGYFNQYICSLTLLTERPYYSSEDGVYRMAAGTAYKTYLTSGDAWSTPTDYPEISTDTLLATPFWTNTDILDTDGAVHLAASDPIPV